MTDDADAAEGTEHRDVGSGDADADAADAAGPFDVADRPLLSLMSALYVVAGAMHFVAPRAYERAIPSSFPRPRLLVYLSGVAEVVLGIGVRIERTRHASAWGIVALLAAVFPANVHLSRRDTLEDLLPPALAGPARAAALVRLPFQAVLMLWAWRYTRPATDGGSTDGGSTDGGSTDGGD